MKTIALKLEQLNTKTVTIEKAIKDGDKVIKPAIKVKEEETVLLKTKEKTFEDTEKAQNICFDFLKGIDLSLKLASQMGANSVDTGGGKFKLNGKFILYVTVDGLDYCLDEVLNLGDLKLTSAKDSFKNPKGIFAAIWMILRSIDGQSVIMTKEATNVQNSVIAQKLLLS